MTVGSEGYKRLLYINAIYYGDNMEKESKKDLANYYAGIGLVFGVIIAVNLTLILEMDYWIVGVGAGLGLVFGAAVGNWKSKSSD